MEFPIQFLFDNHEPMSWYEVGVSPPKEPSPEAVVFLVNSRAISGTVES